MKACDIPKFGCLQGIKLVNCASAVGGPVLGCLFAEQGANVIHIEGPRIPDMFHMFQWGWSTDRRNMRDLCLDIFSEEGRDVFKKIISDADVFVESSRGGTWADKGITDDYLWDINPKLIILHISGFGLTGLPEWVKKPSYDQVGQAFSGVAALNADMNGPMLIKPYPTDFYVALLGAWAVTAALYRRQVTGKGESMDLAQFEASLRCHTYFSGEGFNSGKQPEVRQSNDPNLNSFYKTKDGKWAWVYPAPGYFRPCMLAVGLDESSGMDLSVPYINFGDDFINILTPKMVEYCGQRTYEEIEAELTPHYWLTAPVLNYADILEHPHYKARESVTTYYAPDMEKDYHAVNTVPKFKNNPSQIWRGGPKLGEDNEDILEEAGLTSDEIQTLYDKKLLRKETRPWPECLKPLK